ncbi:MAG: 2OG-Fe(II) oxygenase [Nitrososphaerales archaeon]
MIVGRGDDKASSIDGDSNIHCCQYLNFLEQEATRVINYTLLESQIDLFSKQFREARPFPHLVVDDFLDGSVAARAQELFPKMEDMDTLNDYRQRKAQDPALDKFHPIFQEIIFEHLHSHRLLQWLARVTGINNLKADAQLYASGLAQGADGSFLNVHLDNSSHPIKPWFRRLNLIVYLNAHWNEEIGGQLEFWEKDMKNQPRSCRLSIG